MFDFDDDLTSDNDFITDAVAAEILNSSRDIDLECSGSDIDSISGLDSDLDGIAETFDDEDEEDEFEGLDPEDLESGLSDEDIALLALVDDEISDEIMDEIIDSADDEDDDDIIGLDESQLYDHRELQNTINDDKSWRN